MQNANVIEGKLSWSGKFIIAAVNASRRFTPLRFDVQEKGIIKAKYKEKDGWDKAANKWNMVEHVVELENIEWRAWALPYGMDFPPGVYTLDQAKQAGLPVIVGPRVSMKLAVEEGWYAKPGSKWQTEMKDLMGMYRAGAYFGNIHAPDVVMGMGRTTEEQQDMSTIDIQQQPNGQYAANAATLDEMRQAAQPKADRHPDAETVEVTDKQPEDKTAPPEEGPVREMTVEELQSTPLPEQPAKEPLTSAVSLAYEALMVQINKAKNLDELADAADLIKNIDNGELRTALTGLYKQRYAEFNPPEKEVEAAPAAPAKRSRTSKPAVE